jgi:CrcB protein
MTLLYIAAGGAVGSVARYALSTVIQQRAAGPFPLGTLVVNVTGSFLLGLLMRYGLATPAFSPEVRALLTVGFCGGYTTFSTFSYETARLMEGGDYRRALAYIAISVVVSIVGIFAGFETARGLLSLRQGV